MISPKYEIVKNKKVIIFLPGFFLTIVNISTDKKSHFFQTQIFFLRVVFIEKMLQWSPPRVKYPSLYAEMNVSDQLVILSKSEIISFKNKKVRVFLIKKGKFA